ncbi:hypothetical protein HMPREF1979_03350 [Actinomyces johnsonii F0542]|uniref:Uncharacterized protein n=1 Tax=Actinomyces johnsonii F0542 TaxID=1321818 RepID=U1PX12_9ACTO|nr:hypothetical protein HMPREF1979_03350 [Actinomyces johnsonii F0542]
MRPGECRAYGDRNPAPVRAECPPLSRGRLRTRQRSPWGTGGRRIANVMRGRFAPCESADGRGRARNDRPWAS